METVTDSRSDDVNRQIIKLHDDGVSEKDIAAFTGYSVEYVNDLIIKRYIL